LHKGPRHLAQHRLSCEPAEQLAVPQHRRLGCRRDRQALADGRHLLLARLVADPERKAGPLDHVSQRRRPHHEHLVATAPGRSQQRHERIEVTRPAERASAEHPQLPRSAWVEAGRLRHAEG
jgi:hypothetical protein